MGHARVVLRGSQDNPRFLAARTSVYIAAGGWCLEHSTLDVLRIIKRDRDRTCSSLRESGATSFSLIHQPHSPCPCSFQPAIWLSWYFSTPLDAPSVRWLQQKVHPPLLQLQVPRQSQGASRPGPPHSLLLLPPLSPRHPQRAPARQPPQQQAPPLAVKQATSPPPCLLGSRPGACPASLEGWSCRLAR